MHAKVEERRQKFLADVAEKEQEAREEAEAEGRVEELKFRMDYVRDDLYASQGW